MPGKQATILQMMLNAPSAQGYDFAGLKVIIGGSALNRALYEAAKARGIQLTAAYGMSETCPLISCAHINDELKAGSEDVAWSSSICATSDSSRPWVRAPANRTWRQSPQSVMRALRSRTTSFTRCETRPFCQNSA